MRYVFKNVAKATFLRTDRMNSIQIKSLNTFRYSDHAKSFTLFQDTEFASIKDTS